MFHGKHCTARSTPWSLLVMPARKSARHSSKLHLGSPSSTFRFLVPGRTRPGCATAFEEIARMTRGAYYRFDQGAAQQLANCSALLPPLASEEPPRSRAILSRGEVHAATDQTEITKGLATNACPRLDILMLHRKGALASGAVSRWEWALPTMARAEDIFDPAPSGTPIHSAPSCRSAARRRESKSTCCRHIPLPHTFAAT